jgi:endonuclease YncB( thermonuclease family)
MITRQAATLLTLLSLWSAVLAFDLIGQASIVDGDPLEIHETRIRLWGIDAPERNSYGDIRRS